MRNVLAAALVGGLFAVAGAASAQTPSDGYYASLAAGTAGTDEYEYDLPAGLGSLQGESDEGFALDAAVGRRFGAFRAELGLGHRDQTTVVTADQAPDERVEGKTSVTTLNLNGYYDVRSPAA